MRIIHDSMHMEYNDENIDVLRENLQGKAARVENVNPGMSVKHAEYKITWNSRSKKFYGTVDLTYTIPYAEFAKMQEEAFLEYAKQRKIDNKPLQFAEFLTEELVKAWGIKSLMNNLQRVLKYMEELGMGCEMGCIVAIILFGGILIGVAGTTIYFLTVG